MLFKKKKGILGALRSMWIRFIALFAFQIVKGDMSEVLDKSATESTFLESLASLGVLEGQADPCGGMDGALVGRVMSKAWFDSALKLVRACVESGVKIDVAVHQEASSMRRKIAQVTALLQQMKMQPQTMVAPAFEWAQNGDSIFMGVKFAHKMDAPACIDAVVDSAEIFSKSIHLQATCTGKNKKFSLIIDLLHEIKPDSSFWTMASVGRGTFTLIKEIPATKWERLLEVSLTYWPTCMLLNVSIVDSQA